MTKPPFTKDGPFAVFIGESYSDNYGRSSPHPTTRHACPKCGYTLTTNEAPQEWKCPIDGEVLEGVAYP